MNRVFCIGIIRSMSPLPVCTFCSALWRQMTRCRGVRRPSRAWAVSRNCRSEGSRTYTEPRPQELSKYVSHSSKYSQKGGGGGDTARTPSPYSGARGRTRLSCGQTKNQKSKSDLATIVHRTRSKHSTCPQPPRKFSVERYPGLSYSAATGK